MNGPSSVSEKFSDFGQLDRCVAFCVQVPSGLNIRCGQAQCKSNVEPRSEVYNLFLFSKKRKGVRGGGFKFVCVSKFLLVLAKTKKFPMLVISVTQIYLREEYLFSRRFWAIRHPIACFSLIRTSNNREVFVHTESQLYFDQHSTFRFFIVWANIHRFRNVFGRCWNPSE